MLRIKSLGIKNMTKKHKSIKKFQGNVEKISPKLEQKNLKGRK